ncbi:septum site-determining protein MinC [Moorella thermoacetica]|uniref:Septum formation inhibitor n=1 Tax=Moorella thermoacetica Y72 TaxID=1325331 RepID=A0A0S6UGZ6_NEOTH|nr:septum formation inhibitor [Moorella thermoacetica Y72]GLI17325.1 septum site-determining protein MinC [Moorella thermoacetica]
MDVLSANEGETSAGISQGAIPSGTRAQPGKDNHTFLVCRTVRSGQVIKYPGNVVVMGDVHPGGEVVATGHVIIMGTLKGVVHAGAEGNEKAVVLAFHLQPTQLRIAGYIGRAPDDGDNTGTGGPEMARVQDDTVVIEKYQPGNEKRWLTQS